MPQNERTSEPVIGLHNLTDAAGEKILVKKLRRGQGTWTCIVAGGFDTVDIMVSHTGEDGSYAPATPQIASPTSFEFQPVDYVKIIYSNAAGLFVTFDSAD